MPQAKLSIPDSPRTLVFRRLIQFAQANKPLMTLIRPTSWYTWDGDTDNGNPFASGAMPLIRLTPQGRGVTPITPVRQASPFGIMVDLAVNSFHIDDLLNAWWLFEKALFPGDGSNALLNAMQGVYPETYDINLESPAVSPQVNEANAEFLRASATLTVQLLIKK